MSVFTSDRERTLWAWTLVILLGIMASALLGGSFVDVLRAHELLDVAFAAGFTVAVVAVVGIAFARPERVELWTAIGALTVLAMIPVRSGVSAAERTHLFEYGLFAVVLYEALAERARSRAGVPLPGLIAVGGAGLVGCLDEAVQSLVPGRVGDGRDVAIDALAAVVAVSVVGLLRRVRVARRRESPPDS